MISQQLIALAAPAKDLGSLPRTQKGSSQLSSTVVPGGCNALFWLPRTATMHVVQTLCMQNTHTRKKKI